MRTVEDEYHRGDAVQESRRKAQEELAAANKAEKAAQKTIATLEKELAAAASKVTCQSP